MAQFVEASRRHQPFLFAGRLTFPVSMAKYAENRDQYSQTKCTNAGELTFAAPLTHGSYAQEPGLGMVRSSPKLAEATVLNVGHTRL